MIHKILISSLIVAAFSGPTFAATAATQFYVEQDAKTLKCMVGDKKPDGKMMMDVGNKVYATKSNAETAMSMLKACTAKAAATTAPAAPVAAAKAAAPVATAKKVPAAPVVAAATGAGFYVGQDAKTHKCMVANAKPDGKLMMDVGTKVYATKGNAQTAMSMLKACKA